MAVSAGRWLEFDAAKQAIVIITVGLVIGAELVNTAIEHTVDLFIKSRHPLARLAKDTAAGAVLWFSFVAILVGALLFAPHLAALPASLKAGPPTRIWEILVVTIAAVAIILSGRR